MKYFELRCTAFIKKDISFKESFEVISKYISFSMSRAEELKKLHTDNKQFKLYSFGSFFPIEKDKIYKSGNSYNFTLRSLDENFIDKLSTALRQNIDNPNFIIVNTDKKTIKQFFITELYSATPVIVSVGNGNYWSIQRDGNILQLQKQLQYNLQKKYKAFYNQELNPTENFIQLIEIKNNYPQSIYIHKNSKEIRFFGNKFRIIPNEDETSQKLAFISLACGLGEKNSFGGGFMLGKVMRV